MPKQSEQGVAADLSGRQTASSSSEDHVAVVDLGSNSVRLVVYDSLSRAPFPRFNEKSLCRLGEGLARDAKLDDQAMDCVVRALERFAAIARAMDVTHIELIATEAIRKASNGKAFRKRLEQASGLTVEVLSGEQEARLAAMGVIAGFHRPQGLVGDFGGGSLELAVIREDTVEANPISLPLGALNIMPRFLDDAKAAKKHIDQTLRTGLPEVLPGGNFYIVGGGWRALAKVHMANNEYQVPVIHGLTLQPEVIRDLAKSLWRMDPDDIDSIDGVPGRRVSTLPAAALVMDRVVRYLQPEQIVFSSLGVREGWLYEKLPAAERQADPLITGCRHLADEASRVPAFSEALTRWTDTLFMGETIEQRRLRIAATTLSDIAWRERGDVQAQHAFERILRFPFIGITHAERVFLAATIHSRYGKRADFDAMQLLDDEQRDRAHVLGTAMLLGYRFSASVSDILDQASLSIDADTVRLEVDDSTNVPDSDAVQNRLSLLAKALKRDKTEVVKRREQA